VKKSDVAGTLETILVVDDEDYIRELVGAILSIEGYKVLEAAGGTEALKVSEEFGERIHLLLTDVVMSPMSGGELVRRIAPLRTDMKILFISGFPDDASARLGMLESQYGFLPKPFSPKILVRKIRSILDAVPAGTEA
jgi:two-component system cell cycle sensor histidine kinase/response regulator CckA